MTFVPGGRSNAYCSECRRASRPAPDLIIPLSHLWLVGAGMFFDGYDLYVAGGVLASPSRPNSTLQNLQFLS
jgi:hypothetical protein